MLLLGENRPFRVYHHVVLSSVFSASAAFALVVSAASVFAAASAAYIFV
jgi:hypothetical protein